MKNAILIKFDASSFALVWGFFKAWVMRKPVEIIHTAGLTVDGNKIQ